MNNIPGIKGWIIEILGALGCIGIIMCFVTLTYSPILALIQGIVSFGVLLAATHQEREFTKRRNRHVLDG